MVVCAGASQHRIGRRIVQSRLCQQIEQLGIYQAALGNKSIFHHFGSQAVGHGELNLKTVAAHILNGTDNPIFVAVTLDAGLILRSFMHPALDADHSTDSAFADTAGQIIGESACNNGAFLCYHIPLLRRFDQLLIFQLIQAIRKGDKVIACVAPAFVGQFGKNATPAKLKKAMRILGFADTVEVAIGADLCTVEEAHDFLDNVPEKLDFMATSCCPAWSVMAKKLFPEFKENISMALTPMVLTARLMKKDNPDARIVFVGPCAAKKLEASRRTVRSDVDFVLTFEELQGMFDAKDIDFATLVPDEGDEDFDKGTGAGRGFAVVGGVAAAVAEAISRIDPDRHVDVEYGDGLRECRKMLTMAKAGKRNGYLLEGMACPGGCVAGAGTITPVLNATSNVRNYKSRADKQSALESQFADRLKEVEE